ncbi:hypothetical protein ACFL54_02965 [Planctomycetota bacterium]
MNELENITHTRLAILLIVIGLLFAADSLLGVSFAYKLWPLLIFMLGTGLVGIYLKRKAKGALYLAGGEYFILFSGLAFYCNFTSWQNLKHLWPIFVGFLGLVFITLFLFYRKKRFLLFLGLLLLSLSIFFLLIFSLGTQFWWIIFMLAGLSILVSGKSKW